MHNRFKPFLPNILDEIEPHLFLEGAADMRWRYRELEGDCFETERMVHVMFVDIAYDPIDLRLLFFLIVALDLIADTGGEIQEARIDLIQ